jgi:hypothetical protein
MKEVQIHGLLMDNDSLLVRWLRDYLDGSLEFHFVVRQSFVEFGMNFQEEVNN